MRSEDEGCAESLPGTGAEWVVYVHSAEMTPDLRCALDQWRAVSAENDVDFRRAETVWRLTGELADDPAIQAELAWLRRKARAREARWWISSARNRLAMAATIVVSIAAALFLVSSRGTDWHETKRGDRSVVQLPDGSSIDVNTDSRIGVRYSTTNRDVTLVRGEALFEVDRDPKRPFTVHARNGHVRALGTRFNVIAEGDLVTVTLLDGRVEVVARGAAGEQRTQLGAGEAAAYGPQGIFVSAEPAMASARRIELWRKGMWASDGWPLERAVREHNRYAHKPIRIGDPELAQEQVSGVFRIGDTDAFVTMVSRTARAEVIDQGDSLLLVPADD